MSNRSKAVLLLVALVLVLGGFLLLKSEPTPEPIIEEVPEPIAVIATSSHKVIGVSVEGREIEVYTFGTGETNLLFVGGVHGGYEWNSVVLAEQVIAAFEKGELSAPEGVTVHVVPNLNPDGVYKVLGMTRDFTAAEALAIAPEAAPEGRFNANGIDLNRNFDCRWQPTSTWRGNVVSAGTEPFSEPEAAALRDYVLEINPAAAIFWHSIANNVYGSECGNGVLTGTESLMSSYAQAGGYGEVLVFDAYPVSGDAEGWLASIGIPAITVELETRNSSEWERNKAGVTAVLNQYSNLAR